MDRRTFLTTAGGAVVAGVVSDARTRQAPPAQPAGQPPREAGPARFRTGLVAYSYRQALEAKTMTYEDVIRIAVETGTDGIDMTVDWVAGATKESTLPP